MYKVLGWNDDLCRCPMVEPRDSKSDVVLDLAILECSLGSVYNVSCNVAAWGFQRSAEVLVPCAIPKIVESVASGPRAFERMNLFDDIPEKARCDAEQTNDMIYNVHWCNS